ncbi:MAG: HesA/MoeB/ThiF family protein [Candidatus Bathyarchaeota archaeon]|nr:HesA/MoeB/ThiF family protein [Candidatus Bathyarchaeota archaeon]
MDVAGKAEFAKLFYSRQILIEELGSFGQEKLSKSRVAIVGVGGLGSVCSLYLALAGVGYLRLIDQDTVETPNLHRQILYTPNDLHHHKAEVAAEKLRKQNPLVQIEAVSEKVDEDNVESLLKAVDVVVDCLDNFQTRYLLNRACIKLKIPYVFGAVMGLEGNLSVFNPPETGCLECTMHNHQSNPQSGGVFGIIGASAGIMGSMQAMETIKLLAGVGSSLAGKLLVCDFRDMDFTVVPLPKNPHCQVCHR